MDLFYVVSTYGNETELEPQRLLGSVVRTFSDKTTVTPELIEQAIDNAHYLAASDLAKQVQTITINPLEMTTDELAKVWSTFFQAPYSLSLVYLVRAVTIDGEKSLSRALPVRDCQFGGIHAFAAQPVLEKVSAIAGSTVPIEATTTLRITGKQLHADKVTVTIGNTKTAPQSVTATEIILPLKDVAAPLQAGMQTIQICHHSSDPRQTIPATSNALPFVLRPAIVSTDISEVEGFDDDPRSGKLAIATNLPVGTQQRVVLMLNEWSTQAPTTYLFEAQPRDRTTDVVVFSFQNVKPGEYLARLQIDGADSLLGIDNNPNSKTYNWFNSPRVII